MKPHARADSCENKPVLSDVNMNERKILLFLLSVIVYCLYSVQMWITKQNVQDDKIDSFDKQFDAVPESKAKNDTQIKPETKFKSIPLFLKDACSVLEIFTEKPDEKWKKNDRDLNTDNNTITVIGITVFLIILTINAILDVLKVKEEERARRKLNPNGERRQSLAEFANKKPFRRESSRFGLQLFQIAESFVSNGDEKKNRKTKRPYVRGESINSYLSENKTPVEWSAPASIGDTPVVESRLAKRQSVAKLFGMFLYEILNYI